MKSQTQKKITKRLSNRERYRQYESMKIALKQASDTVIGMSLQIIKIEKELGGLGDSIHAVQLLRVANKVLESAGYQVVKEDNPVEEEKPKKAKFTFNKPEGAVSVSVDTGNEEISSLEDDPS